MKTSVSCVLPGAFRTDMGDAVLHEQLPAMTPTMEPLSALHGSRRMARTKLWDVITAAAGASADSMSSFGTVSVAGGNNVAWLTCATFDACKINSTASLNVEMAMAAKVTGELAVGKSQAPGQPRAV